MAAANQFTIVTHVWRRSRGANGLIDCGVRSITRSKCPIAGLESLGKPVHRPQVSPILSTRVGSIAQDVRLSKRWLLHMGWHNICMQSCCRKRMRHVPHHDERFAARIEFCRHVCRLIHASTFFIDTPEHDHSAPPRLNCEVHLRENSFASICII